MTPRAPLRGAESAFTVRRGLPFVIVLAFAALTPALPDNSPPRLLWWAIAWALLAVLVAFGYLASRRPAGHWTQSLAPLLAFPVIHALRTADGYGFSGLAPLVFLPVVFFALYGRRRDVVVALGAALAVLVAPILAIGGPDYPPSTMRGVLLTLAVLTANGLLIHQLVASLQRATARLKVSETLFRAAFDDAPTAIALVGVAGADGGKFLRVNRAMCNLFGRTATELTNQPMETFTHPGDGGVLHRLFTDVATTRSVHRIQNRFVHSSGRNIWAAVSISTVNDHDGRPLYIIEQIEDVGARRESDRALLEALEHERAAIERARERERVRSELISGVAHDLRTPLTAASGFTELLADETVGPLTDDQHAALQTIGRNLARLASMVEELLAASRRDRERERPPLLAAVDIDAVVLGAVQATTLAADANQQTISGPGAVTGARVRGDAHRLDRALANLLGNAMKFTAAGGTVSIGTSMTDTEAIITVSDNGIGISAEDQQKIFERFYRSGNAVDKAINGSGLGLAIVKEIAVQHGGTIDTASEPGHGSTFTLRLPLLLEV